LNDHAKEITALQKQVRDLQDEEGNLRKLSSSFEQRREYDVSSLDTSIKKLKKEQVDIDKKYSQEMKMAELVNKYEERIEWLRDHIDTSIDEKLSSVNLKKASNDKELQLLNQQLKQFKDLVAKGKCPTCMQKVGDEHIYETSKPIQNKIEIIENDNRLVKIAVGEYSLIVEQNNKYKKERDDLKVKSLASGTILKNAKQNHDMMTANMARHLSDCEKQLVIKKGEANNYGVLADGLLDKIKGLQSKINEKDDLIKKSAGFVDAYNILNKAFSKEGVKAFVFAKIINEINFYVSEYLRYMFDSNISLKFDIQSTNSQGQIKQKIDTIVWVRGERRNLNLLSGGERARLILATNFALARIISSRCGSVPNFIVLDEAFVGIDTSGKSKIMTFLKKMSDTKDFVFVIDHNNEFKEMFDSTFYVEKRQGISELIIE
jgi:DNA repair exonuclease SbcCD ATPase subunit